MFRSFIFFLFFILLTSSTILNGQVSGIILDEAGEPLLGASVLLKNTSRGSTTNKSGYFNIINTPDTFTLIVSYVGSKTKYVSARRNARLTVTLQEEIIEFAEVVIKSGENPALAIIRKAMEKRKELADIKDHYQTQAYTKGIVLSKNGYEQLKTMGIIDSSEVRDTAGNVILYLAESVTSYTKIGKDAKENILSSRRSGDTKGIALNFLQFFNIDFTDNYIEFQKNVVNPIGSFAFQYYNYELEGSYYEDLQKYYKIKVIPKRKEEAVFFGSIYIADEYFTLKQVDLFTRGPNVGIEIMDSLLIKQSFLKIDGFEKWMPLAQSMEFKAGFFGIKFEGSFIGMYNDYKLLNPNAEMEDRKTVIEFDKLAGKKSNEYWDSLRPIPLTIGEKLDYQKRDSIAIVVESKPYLDSVDHVRNKFKLKHLLGNYTYRNSYRKYSIGISNIATSILFNPVQGFYFHPDIRYNKNWEAKQNTLSIKLTPIYGFSENKLRYSSDVTWRHRGEHNSRIRLNTGNTLDNYNNLEPIKPFANGFSSLWVKRNHARFYNNKYISLSGVYALVPGLNAEARISAQNRTGLENNTNYSIRKKDIIYQKNYPEEWGVNTIFPESNAYTTALTINWQPGSKVIKLPDEAFTMSSGYPVFEFSAINAWELNDGDAKYNRVNFNIKNIRIPLTILGSIQSNIYTGMFYGDKPQQKIDYAHFAGNKIVVKPIDTYLSSFKNLSYYEHSTNDKYVTLFSEWNLEGFLFKKIPLLNKTGFNEIISFNGLMTPEAKNIFEIGAGLDRIGFGAFRLFRFDYYWSFEQGKYKRSNFVVGVNFAAILGAIGTTTD